MSSMRIVRVGGLQFRLHRAMHLALAKLTASFEVTSASWQATHIMVVETTPIGGAF